MAEAKRGQAPVGRQAAYVARNRAALIQAGQELLHEIGPSATIEQISAHAQVSPATIYKYFQNKDQFFAQSLGEAWESWLGWAATQNVSSDPLQRMVDLGRRLFRTPQTHPDFAQMLHNSLREIPDFLIRADQGAGKEVFRALATLGKIELDDFDKRWIIWANIASGLWVSVLANDELSPEEADIAFGIGLSVWGITPAKATKLLSRDLGFKPTK